MSFIHPYEDYLNPVSATSPSGEVSDIVENVISSIETELSVAASFQSLAIKAEALFRGGKIASQTKGQETQVKPVKHLYPALLLAAAWFETDGLAGFADGLALIEAMLSSQWNTVHPVGNVDDPDDPDPYFKRFNILSPLSVANPSANNPSTNLVVNKKAWDFESLVFKSVLFESEKYGSVNFADSISPWAGHFGLKVPASLVRTKFEIYDVRLTSSATNERQMEALKTCIRCLESIQAIFRQNRGELKPNPEYLISLLKAGLAVVEGSAVASTSDPLNPALPTGTSPTQAAVVSANQSITGLQQAMDLLEAVSEYFRLHEPSSPVSLLINRSRSLVGMDFFSLLEEFGFGEQVVGAFEKVGGKKPPINPASINATSVSASTKHTVESRDEALRLISDIAEYFHRTDPSSPVIPLLDRARRLVGKTFATLLEDLNLAEAISAFENIAGVKPGDSTKPGSSERS